LRVSPCPVDAPLDQKQVSLRFSRGPAPDPLSPVVTSATERWKTMPVPVQEGGLSVVLSPQSITTLIGTRTPGR